ncbi:MAG: FtsX-like permease family protein [Candidatus Angelobacter sp.]
MNNTNFPPPALRGFATNYANILALAKAGETVGVDKDPRFLDLMTIALALALVGIFSLVAYSVAQRTTEFGVGLALGAPRKHVLWVAARIALVSAAAGIVIGLAFESFLGAVLSHWMQNTFAARSLFAAAALLALSALLACLWPARHAIAVSPTEALRYE